MARLIGYSIVGVEPSIMGIGPAPAIKNLLKVTGKTLDNIEIVEVRLQFIQQKFHLSNSIFNVKM